MRSDHESLPKGLHDSIVEDLFFFLEKIQQKTEVSFHIQEFLLPLQEKVFIRLSKLISGLFFLSFNFFPNLEVQFIRL